MKFNAVFFARSRIKSRLAVWLDLFAVSDKRCLDVVTEDKGWSNGRRYKS